MDTISSNSNQQQQQQHHSTECDLIKYIINRIRNQTHTNTLINDALLVDVAKLTATVAQNAQPLSQNLNTGNNNSNISPKKIYAKIKKLSLPKERDEFLRWYQNYLENTLFGNQPRQAQGSEKGKSSTPKQTNNQQQQIQDIQAAPNTDDGDLAEADQNCSLNNSGNANISNGITSTYHQSFAEDNSSNSKISIKSEPINGNIEYENNENPDENNRDTENAGNDLQNSETPLHLKQHEKLSASNSVEKTDLKSEKPEFTEKD